MDPHAGKWVLNGAPSQAERRLSGPATERARVDARTPDELRAFGVRVAELIRFYDLEDRIDGDWAPFFLSDPGVLEAAVATGGAEAGEGAVAALAAAVLAEKEPAAKLARFRALVAAPHGVARQADAWLRTVRMLPPRAVTRRMVRRLSETVRDELAPALRRLRGVDEGAGERGALGARLGLPYAGFSAEWEAERFQVESGLFRGGSAAERIDAAVPRVVELHAALVDGVASLRDAAEGMRAEAEEGAQRPQMALFDAFVQLFGTAQATVDTLAGRYAEFYYRDVLREPARGPVPDRLALAFALEEDGGGAASVPRGTLFPAGEDAEGATILYAADRGVTVTRAALARVRMLRAIRGPLLPPGPGEAAEPEVVVQRVLASALAEEAVGGAAEAGWPTFGRDAPGVTGPVATEPATLGFAVASRELLLGGGRRYVAVRFRAAPDEALERRLAALGAAVGIAPWEALTQVLAAGLVLRLTTAEGWLTLEGYRAVARPPEREGEGAFTLGFELPPSAPAVVPLPTEAGEETAPGTLPDPAPGVPTLAATVRPDPVEVSGPAGRATVYPLSLLERVRVRYAEVRVRVVGLRPDAAYNPDGEVDAGGPFPVFGAIPALGGALELRAAELFVKAVHALTVTVRWSALPPTTDGFRGWYRDYTRGLEGPLEPPIDNATFRGRWNVVNPGRWRIESGTPGGVGEPVFLFRAEPECEAPEPAPAAPLCPETRFAELRVVPVADGPPKYYDPAEGGLRLELTAPPYAFGNDIYPINVLACVVADLPDTSACCDRCLAECDPCRDDPTKYAECLQACMALCMGDRKELRYPNEPYLPVAERVGIDYGSGERIVPGAEGGLFHLHPFDGWTTIPDAPAAGAPLLPPAEEAGSLLLGFTGLASETVERLTLLFRMEVPGGEADTAVPPAAWSALRHDRWAPLGTDAVPRDGTDGLRNSGIVALDVPPGVPGGTRIPGPERWLRAAVPVGAEGFPWTVSIHPHAVSASWVPTGEATGVHLGTPLPAGTISTSMDALPGIAEILQPMPSVGGRPPESAREYEVRVGERLRHRERAVQPWDHTRLVLERFPTVWKVAALPARDRRGHAPGATLVVVVAGESGNESADPTVPRAPGALLASIRDFLSERASPFARIEVVNPAYVRVRVSAEVDFVGGPLGGDADRLNADLVAYLSPWFYDAAREARHGAYAFEGDISEFIQTRPYVASLRALSLDHDPDPAELEWYFLTSADHHEILGSEPPGGAR